MENVIIVESPSKSKTIGSYLGKGFLVLSSKGHIRDLATTGKDGLGIDVENDFTPNYKIMDDKESLVSYLKSACNGKNVYLATDPDREGEAIAYHLATVLGLDLNAANRIEFHEITKDAVRKALEVPHPIDMKMVDSQECRRMIDRILGFKLSKLLQKKIASKSAGRVQSVVLKMIVDLEKEIQAFTPINYYEMEAIFNTFKLKLSELNGVKIDSKNRILDRNKLEVLQPKLLSFVVSDVSNHLTRRNSYPAFTTSTLQQEASSKLGFSPTQTMRIAQGLYEGKNIGSETVGLITYMRTDSTRLADVFVKDCEKFIINNYGQRYLGELKIKTSKNMQDAHEAIRPTSILRNPEELKKYLAIDEYRLYKLIYNRTLASLMAPAVFNSTKVEFTNTNSIWTASGQALNFDGFLKVYGKSEDDENSMLPNFILGQAYNANEVNILDKQTLPPSRYTEATLIKSMEQSGIGRPSTYAQTIRTLKDRKYVVLEKKCLIPTEQGILTTNKLDEFFSSVINISYTADMESDLDDIANGNKERTEELRKFYEFFMPIFYDASKNMSSLYPIFTDQICPECGSRLVYRHSDFGDFLCCSNYPKCKYKPKEEKNENDNQETDVLCPECNNAYLVRRLATKGKNKGNYFYSCGNYPKCKTVFNDEPTNEHCINCGSIMLKTDDGLVCSKHCDEIDENPILCPDCNGGHLVKRLASKGKNKGNYFYACSNFPKCKTTFSFEPTFEKCPNCGSIMLKTDEGLICSKECDKTTVTTNNVICPECKQGHLVQRVASKGKNKGNIFYGCSNYPRCKKMVSEDEYKKLS